MYSYESYMWDLLLVRLFECDYAIPMIIQPTKSTNARRKNRGINRLLPVGRRLRGDAIQQEAPGRALVVKVDMSM